MPLSIAAHVTPVKPDSSAFLRQLAEAIKPVTPVAWDNAAREEYVWNLAHEAGHTLMAMDCGLGIQPVELTDNGANVTWNAPSPDLPEITRSLIQARIFLAGYAVSKFMGDAYCIAWQLESLTDPAKALACLERGCNASKLLAGYMKLALSECYADSATEVWTTINRANSEMISVAPVEQVTRIRSKAVAQSLPVELDRELDTWILGRLDAIRGMVVMWAEARDLAVCRGNGDSCLSVQRAPSVRPVPRRDTPIWQN